MKLQNVSAQSFGNLNSDKKAKGSGIKGGSLALLGAVGANTAISSLSLGSMNVIKKQAKNFTKDEIKAMNYAADEILNNVTNLSKKGVKIFDYSDSHNLPLAVTDLAEKIPERFQDCIAILATKNGKNAYFSSKVPKNLKGAGLENLLENVVGVNRQEAPNFIFHELGHAFNYHNSGVFKAMQKIRPLAMLLGVVLSVLPAFTKKEEAQDGKELTKAQKVKNFIREKSPFIAAASFVPIVAEEAMATIRGNKWAKELLSPDAFKKVRNGNLIALSTYAIVLAAMGLSALAAKKIKDHFDNKAKAAQQA